MDDQPVDFDEIQDPGDEANRYRAVLLDGRYLTGRQILLDSMIDKGRAGYQVLTPVARREGGPLVLVNRGWVPVGADRTTLPDVSVDNRQRRIRARLSPLPRPGMRLGSGNADSDQSWPRLMLFPTRDELASALGTDVADGQLLLSPDDADGYVRRWQPAGFGPERHVGYAVQWFALAATLFVIYLVFNTRRTRSS